MGTDNNKGRDGGASEYIWTKVDFSAGGKAASGSSKLAKAELLREMMYRGWSAADLKDADYLLRLVKDDEMGYLIARSGRGSAELLVTDNGGRWTLALCDGRGMTLRLIPSFSFVEGGEIEALAAALCGEGGFASAEEAVRKAKCISAFDAACAKEPIREFKMEREGKPDGQS